MTSATALERWYRRLLAWYPAEHRRVYGEEMMGVLLASAKEDRRHPGIADVIDLIRGGLRARLRPASDGRLDVGWRDTFAVFSIVAPTLAGVYYVVNGAVSVVNLIAHSDLGGAAWPIIRVLALPALLTILAIAGPPLLALRGLRRTAIMAALASTALVALLAIRSATIFVADPYADSGLVWYAIFFLLETIALAISPGPRRGTAIMTGRAWIILAGATGLAAIAARATDILVGGNPAAALIATITLAAIAAAAAIGLLMALAPPFGSRLLLLLAIPGYPAVIASSGIGAIVTFGSAARYSLALIYLPPIALAGLVAILARRSARRGRAAPG